MPDHSKNTGDYRIFVGAFIEGELGDRIQAVRMRYDPVTARISPPHITFAGIYWRKGLPVAENEAETVRRLEILPGILQPFHLHLKGVHTFPGKKPVVHLGVEANQGVIEARNLLLSVIGPDNHRHFHPHLTLAMRLPWFETWTMVSELQESEWNKQRQSYLVTELRLMQRGTEDRSWRCIHRMSLTSET